MPKPRERDPSDKIKGKGKNGGRPVRDVRRQMTAKLRKELVEQKRAGQEPPADVQAADQVEQTGAAAFDEVGREAERLIDRAIHPDHRPRERTEAIKGDGQRPQEGRPANQATHKTGQRQSGTAPRQNAARPSGAKTGAVETGPVSHYIHGETDTPPTPQERMKRQAAKELERAGHTGDSPQGRGAPHTSPHYGGRPPEAVSSKNDFSPANQSIHLSNPSSNRPSIKERPRRSAAPREKPPGGAFIPKTRQRVEQAARKGAAAGKATLQEAGKPAAKQIVERARRKAQAAAQKGLAQRAKQAAKTAAGLSKKAVVGVTKAVAAMVSALVSLVGGAVLVLALAVVLLIGALLASPFGIFFSGEPTKDAVPLSTAVAQVNVELTDKLEGLQGGEYDRVEIQGQPPDWSEVAAVFAAKTAGAEDGTDVAVLTPDKVELLKNVYWDMCAISSTVETIEHPASGDEDAWTEKVLIITITPKTAEEMRTAYAFKEFQNQSLTDLLAEGDSLAALLGDLAITQADAVELLRDLPAGLDPERRAVVETACKLVGKVNYFWGGKSLTMGWNDTWGTLRQVTAAGSSTTGTYRPYGLDCSGFVDWVFYNITGGEYVIGHGGGAHAQHTYCTAISWEEAQPGDLVFYLEDSHVGIVGGRDENGNLLIVHCASGANNVVITGLEGFTSIGRPLYYRV